MSEPEVQFRQYTKGDLHVCSRFAADAWPSISNIVSEPDAERFMSAYVELCCTPSTWKEVACISGNVVGFLFGRIDKDVTMSKGFHTLFSTIVLLLRLLLGKYGKIAEPFTFLKKFIATESKVSNYTPKVDGTIELFVVDANFRGRKIGKKLLDRFIAMAQKKNVKSLSVYTDPLSNWKFYEVYGFQRICTFHDDLNSYIEQKDVEGYIYTIEIQ